MCDVAWIRGVWSLYASSGKSCPELLVSVACARTALRNASIGQWDGCYHLPRYWCLTLDTLRMTTRKITCLLGASTQL